MGNLIGYLSSLLAFSFIFVLVLVLWRGRLQGVWLIQAILFSAIWSAYLALSTSSDQFNPTNQTFIEILRATGWILLLWRLYAQQQNIGAGAFWKSHLLWAFGLLIASLLVLNLLQGTSLGVFSSKSLFFMAPFVLVIIALVLLEQWYRGVEIDNRWRVKFFAISLAIIFSYDFVLFSEGMLYQRLDSDLWLARGWINMLVTPFMAVAISRTRDWEQPVRVSHQAAFYSTSLFLAGIYLIIMAAVGYYIRWFGGGWGGAIQVVFVVISLSFLSLLFASGTARATVSVWIGKHFFSYKYDYREQWVQANNRLAELPLDGGYYQALISAIATPLDSMGGWLWVNESATLVCRARLSTDQSLEFSAAEARSLVDFCAMKGWVIELEEYRADPGYYPGLYLASDTQSGQELWLIVPLLHQGALYGLVGLRHPRAKRSINWEDYDLLKALGGQVATLIALKDASEALSEARQFEAFNRFSAFVVHDLKNIVAQLSLVVSNAERHRHNPEFIDDALGTLSNAVGRMNRLLSQLRQQSQLNAKVGVVSALAIVKDVHQHQKEQRPAVTLEVAANESRIRIEKDRLVAVLGHLVQNAQEATPDDGVVSLSVREEGDRVVFTVADTGCGMDDLFIQERLFKPFDTTKGSAGMGIGVYEAQQFIRENGGSIGVESRPGEGSVFSVRLPRYRDTVQ